MIPVKPSFAVWVDVTNPGQFFACCGLLELAHRFWPGAEGWFHHSASSFEITSTNDEATLEKLIADLRACDITGLTDEEREERDALEAEKRRLRRDKKKLPGEKEGRRAELGTKARSGAVILGKPFRLTLSWWQGEENTPKTWAGRQEIHKVARAAQDALATIADASRLFDHRRVMRMPAEYRTRRGDENKVVEPFYFDARRFVHALDTGFSLDVQDSETLAHPAVELLALVGLQRFRPIASEQRGALDFYVWSSPLPVSIASAVASGAVWHPDVRPFTSQLRYRDNQKRYKAFNTAHPRTNL